MGHSEMYEKYLTVSIENSIAKVVETTGQALSLVFPDICSINNNTISSIFESWRNSHKLFF